jgi:hypothetical protein
MDSKMELLLKFSKAILKAGKLMNMTVDRFNEDAVMDAAEALDRGIIPLGFGIKNTSGIQRKYIDNLLMNRKFIWNTIDSMSDGGRAVDIKLTNPLTGKIMTGSSSATAINVLYGINDIGIGTDGGGSVLAPALSLNLFSVMAKGMGLKAQNKKKSTDGIEFVAGIGVISYSLKLAEEAVYDMLGLKSKTKDSFEDNFNGVKVAVPCSGNIKLPNGCDMRICLDKAVYSMKEMGIEVYEENFPDFKERDIAILRVQELLKKYDVLMTFEGPVDIEGLGDSVFGNMGEYSKEIQNRSGKYMVKIANMVNSTAVTIPVDEAASGIALICREGIDNGERLIKICKRLSSSYELPKLYYDYFLKSYLRRKNEYIFSMSGDERI